MPGILGHTTMNLLGLERHLWDDTDSGECIVYHLVTLAYLGFLICASGGMLFLLYLITSSWITAVVLGLMVTFIIASVVRFSLIILRKSLFDESTAVIETIDNEKNVPIAGEFIEPSEIEPTPNPRKEESEPRKRGGFTGYLRKSVSTVFGSLGWPAGRLRAPGLGLMIHGVILTMMVCLVGFPLSCLFHRERILDINAEQRVVYLQKFREQFEAGIQAKTRPMVVQFEQLERVLSEKGADAPLTGLQAERMSQLQALRAMLDAERAGLAADLEHQAELYRQRLEHSHFLILSFISVSHMPAFRIIMLLVAMLVFLPHILLDILRKRKGSSYAQRSTDYYRSLIDAEYRKTEDVGYRHLWTRYQYDPKAFKRNIHWENPPYNTIQRVMFPKRSLIDRRQFEDHANKSIDSSH